MDKERIKYNPTEKPNNEEQDYNWFNEIVYQLFDEYIEELGDQTEDEYEEEQRVLASFAENERVPEKSPYVMLYAGFRAGVDKGLEFCTRLGNGT